MNKYIFGIIVFAAAGLYGFKQLKTTYHKLALNNEQLILKAQSQLQDDRINGEVIYSVIVDRFADGSSDNNKDVDLANPLAFHGGDLKGLAQNLDELEELGITALLLSPLFKQAPTNKTFKLKNEKLSYPRFPFNGENADNFEEMDSRFGSIKDLLNLTIKSHEKGIKVFLTMDLNSVAPASNFLANNPDFFQPGRPVLNQKSEKVQRYLLQTIKSKWARLGIDGIFFKNATAYNKDFFSQLSSVLKNDISRDFKIIADFNPASKQGLELINKKVIDWNYERYFASFVKHTFSDIEKNINKMHLHFKQKFSPPASSQTALTLIKTPGMPSFMYSHFSNEKVVKLMFTFHVAMGTIPILDFGEEVGKEDTSFPFVKTDYPWGQKNIGPGRFLDRNKSLFKHYKNLIQVYKKRFQLLKGQYMPYIHATSSTGKKIFCFFKGESKLLEARDKSQTESFTPSSFSCFNLEKEKVVYSLPMTRIINEWVGEKSLTNLINGQQMTRDEQTIELKLAPEEGAIFAPL